jgi:hypothetical protein
MTIRIQSFVDLEVPFARQSFRNTASSTLSSFRTWAASIGSLSSVSRIQRPRDFIVTRNPTEISPTLIQRERSAKRGQKGRANNTWRTEC